MWMPSLDLATGLWARMRRTLYTLFSRLSRAAQRFWMSRAYFPVLLTVSAAFMAAGEPVYGVVALGCIVIWLLAACPDLLAPVCPFFMAFLMSSQCYGQLTDFLPCAALVPPLLVALLWHFAVWPVTLRIGRSGLGLALVSIATLLGGCDVISRKQAMEPLSLYYTLGLGVGMLVLYVLFRSHLTEKRSYDLHRRFAEIFCALGLCMALAVLLAYGKAWLAEGHIGGVLYLSYRNFATSVLLTALPMPFYLSLRHRGHLATAAVLALALALTGSRSALLFGGILLTLCCVYLMRSGVISPALPGAAGGGRRHRHPGPGARPCWSACSTAAWARTFRTATPTGCNSWPGRRTISCGTRYSASACAAPATPTCSPAWRAAWCSITTAWPRSWAAWAWWASWPMAACSTTALPCCARGAGTPSSGS